MSYFIYFSFKSTAIALNGREIISESEVNDGLQFVCSLTPVASTPWFFLGDGHSSHNLIDKRWVDRKEVTVLSPVIDFFISAHRNGHYPSMLIRLEGRDKEPINLVPEERVKVSIENLNSSYVFKEQTRYIFG